MRIALITSVFGDYDPIRPYNSKWGFDDAVCVTDDSECQGWRKIYEENKFNPRLLSKKVKMTPWNYTDCDAAVWIDGSIEITSNDFRNWIEPLLEKKDLWVWQHPEKRIDIKDEADACCNWPKYNQYPINEQVDFYYKDGFPKKWGLFATGVIAWKFTEKSKHFGKMWLEEQHKWSIQDQISLPYLLWKEGFEFGTFPANQYDNPFFKIRWDERKVGQGPNAPY